MSCSSWEEKLALYAGGDLESSQAAEVESHLSVCTDCRTFLDHLNQSLALLQTEVLDLSAVNAMREKTMSSLRHASRPFWRYAAAAAVVMLSGLASWHWTQAVLPLPTVPVAVAAPNLPAVTTPALIVMPVTVHVRKVNNVKKHEPVVVKLQTDDPDVVIYWVTD